MGLLNAERRDHYQKADPSSRWALLRMARTLERPRHFLDFVDFELVADLEVVEVFHRHAALETGFYFTHVVLEALERIDLARMDDHVVAQHAHRRVAAHETLEHHASSDGPDLGNLEYLPHVDQSEYILFFLRREHARERRLHFIDRVIDNVVVAYVHPRGLGRFARGRIGAGIEADDHGLGGERKIHVGLRDRAHRAVHNIDLGLVDRASALIEHGANPAEAAPGEHDVAAPERSGLN